MLPTRQFWGNHFWRELILGEGRGCFLTAKALLWFPFLGTLWFPWQQRSPTSKVLLKAWPGMLPAITHGQGCAMLLAGAVS